MRITALQLSLASLSLVTVACVDKDQPEHPDPEVLTSQLEKENGGFDTEDEAPAFAADEVFADASIEADATFDDAMARDASMVELQGNANVQARRVMLLWGQMPANPNASERDWSGELKLSRGGMIVKRRIAFEDATDRILPRTSRDTIAFESITKPHADGLTLIVLDPTPNAPEPLTLTYTAAGGITHTLDLAQLATGPLVVDAGDGARVVAVGRPVDPCDHGYLRGRWHNLAPNLGVYLGVVADADGAPIGHVRGIYGTRQNGNQVMFGKFITADGTFKGVIAGTYADGRFDARWLDRDGDKGVIHGAYFVGEGPRGGNFVARWGEKTCAGR